MHLQQAIMLRRPPKIDAFRLSNEQTKTGGETREGRVAGAGEIEEGEERRADGLERESLFSRLARSCSAGKVGPFYTQAMGELLHACFVSRFPSSSQDDDGSRCFVPV